MNLELITGFAGGLGLFLLGMRLMTGGLRKAAGRALRHVLSQWTRTPFRGLLSGFLITALVQSSSAVTVAVIGFANAGLLSLGQSVGVIYGSNIGTTVTGWIVAAVGVNVKVKALALPLIGIGALVRLTGGETRRAPLGDALAGFGLFFLGIEVLQEAFHGLEQTIDLATFASGGGVGAMFAFLGIGFVLTLAMQSSSAAMALVLTAALSGIIDVRLAAAAVVGTNVGTTSTAMLSVIGATHKAKKVAAAHILFNLGTGIVAMSGLPLMLDGVIWLQHFLGSTHDPALTLALFHTCFNLLGVLIFLPLIPRTVRFLDRHIGRKLDDAAKPRYLDDNVLATPNLAVDALFMELGRMGEMARLLAQRCLAHNFKYPGLRAEEQTLSTLIGEGRDFTTRLQRQDLGEKVSQAVSVILRVLQYFTAVGEIALEQTRTMGNMDFIANEEVREAVEGFKTSAKDLLNVAHTPCVPEFDDMGRQLSELTGIYHQLKAALLGAGAMGVMEIELMVQQLEFYSRARRMVEQAVKGTTYWASLREVDDTCRHAVEDNQFSWRPPA